MAINQRVMLLREEGQNILHFGFGQSPFGIPEKMITALNDNAWRNEYLPTLGLPELRSTIAEFLKKFQNINAKAESILIGPGSKELLHLTILMIDGTYLIPRGSWVSYLPQVKLNNKKFALLNTPWEHNYKLQPEELKRSCSDISGTKILILNSPNNPTGAVYTAKELRELAVICREEDVLVISDEIYSQLTFENSHAISISEFYPEKTMVFGGLSKVFAAGGYRLGYLHLPPHLQELKSTYSSVFSETFSAVSTPIQYAALAAFDYDREIREEVAFAGRVLNHIAKYVYDQLTKARIVCTRPEGGFYLLIDFERYKKPLATLYLKDCISLANYILDHHQVALLPGTDFYFPPDALIFRLAYVDFDGKKMLEDYQKNENRPLDLKFIEIFAPNVFQGVQNIIEFVGSLD